MINEDKMYVCKVCGESFNTERSLHAHLKKHNLTVAEYYTTHFPKKDLLTGDPLPFKNKKDYFNRDFLSRNRLIKWLSMQSREDAEVRKYIINKLSQEELSSKGWSPDPLNGLTVLKGDMEIGTEDAY